ncbi:prolyl aminopeptidase [Lacibacterium aquatile]|uniref:Proline iminopeptidase n=1 Tax=Lacibacterium aquatile TaxID=1168082 RepID=A0ABW5DN49_9PROT
MDFSRLLTTSKATTEWSYPQASANRDGYLDVGAGHRLRWWEYGNPDGEPVMYLHGGPGGGSSPLMARFFDPKRYRVILFDQRGCGESEPNVAKDGPAAALTNNTTSDLVDDINRLRDALKITGKMHVFGGSWGSTLALVYAIRHPQHVASLILRGIFIGGREDLLYLYQGNAATFAQDPFGLTEPGAYVAYPDEWAELINFIPPEKRGDIMAAYKTIFDMVPANEAERDFQFRAAMIWSDWEGAISYMVPMEAGRDPGKFGAAHVALCVAQIEAHYFANDMFLDTGYILNNVDKIAGIPTHIVHGRFDQVCPMTQASQLVAALTKVGAPPASFIKTNAGHSAMEGQTVLALTAIMDGLPPLK